MEERHPGDSRNLDFIAGPPTQATIERIRDVVIVPTQDAGTFEEYRKHPPAADPPFELGFDVGIHQPDSEEAELVLNACAPRAHYFVPVRQFGPRFAYERLIALDDFEANRFNWDNTGVLQTVLALSRLVRDNAHDAEFGARIVDYADGMQQVIPAPLHARRGAYRLRTERDWLDVPDAEDLRELLAAYYQNEGALPDRVRRALWMTESVSRERVLDLALPLMVTAVEALTNTSRREVRMQFSRRVSAIAAELDVDCVTEQLCGELWDARSQASHGARVVLLSNRPEDPHAVPTGPPAEAVAKVARLQAALRAMVRRAIEDPDFRAVFDTAEAIRSRWPVVIEL